MSDTCDELGEGPRWHVARQELIWVDILAGTVRWAGWSAGGLRVLRTVRLDRPVGAITPVAGGGYLAAAADGLAWLEEAGTLTPLPGAAGTAAASPDGSLRMNDATCDPWGRFWAGSMPYDTRRTGAGRLVRLDPDLSLTTVLDAVTVSNGLVWNAAADRMWYADSADPVVWQFDVDPDSGAVRGRRPFAELAGAVPDGMCRDDEDHVWVAAHGGAAVHRYDPHGRLVGTVDVPGVAGVTSCAFGGADGGTLFITTGHIGLDPAARAAAPLAGRLHAVDPGVTGPGLTEFAGRRFS
ncbi:MAG TPA: SMP-30/gluconolactonase/LRE family protein [Mycobacteriales bacterium]|nr:SMP-30/gluconolactonase/LRE family protein [Mycobacteriales bacterium]